LALICVAAPASAAVGSGTAYDGSWSVVIDTRGGARDPIYQSGVKIRGDIVFSEAGGINMNGRVSPKGVLRAIVSAGGQSATRLRPVVPQFRRRLAGPRQQGQVLGNMGSATSRVSNFP